MTSPICTRCRATNRDRARFCDTCGMELRPSIGKAAQFLLEDEIKYVTVLFGDIVNSTAWLPTYPQTRRSFASRRL